MDSVSFLSTSFVWLMNLLRYLSSFYQANEKYYNTVHYVHESFLNILILFTHLTKILNENSKLIYYFKAQIILNLCKYEQAS